MARGKTTAEGRLECDHCPKPATANFQKVWVKWVLKENGDYSKLPQYGSYATGKLNEWDGPTGENNIHVCEEHEGALLNGEIAY